MQIRKERTKMSDWSGEVIFWRRMTAKISAWGKGDRDRLLLLGGHINMKALVVTSSFFLLQIVVLPS